MGTLKNILNENNCSKKYGNVLFKLFSDLGYYKDISDEEDTDDEGKLFMSLQKFFQGEFDYQNKSKELEKNIIGLMKCKGLFKGALNPPNKTLFRGTSITVNEYENIKDTLKASSKYTIGKKYIYKPKSKLQSFTTEFTTAETFIMRQMKHNSVNIPCIIKIDKPDKSFIFDNEFTNMFMFDEDEVVRYGGNIKSEIWIPNMILDLQGLI